MRKVLYVAGLGAALIAPQSSPIAAPLNTSAATVSIQARDNLVTNVVVVRRRTTAVVGPNGNAVVRRSTTVWARPGSYYWAAGGAVAAGAAIGYVTAKTAVVWAGAAPAPGMCWYYTDPSRKQGFWDYCPR